MHTPPRSLLKDKSIPYGVKTTIISQEDKAISTNRRNNLIHTWSYSSTTFHKNKAHCRWVLQWESLGTPCSTLSSAALLSFLPLSPPVYPTTQATSPPKQHIVGFHVYTCLYGFPFAPAFYGTAPIRVAVPGFCHQKKSNPRTDLHDSEKPSVSYPAVSILYPVAFRFFRYFKWTK